MADYPIPVSHYDKENATLAVCEDCGHEWKAKPDEVADAMLCPKCEQFAGVFKYAEGDECVNCGALGFGFIPIANHRRACSRACVLQIEYAERLTRGKV